MQGIDASAAMVEQLRAKPGGDAIPVTLGDMAQIPAGGSFGLVYLIYPGELDLMAGVADLRLAARYADWYRRPFTSASDSHVSVYQRP